MRESHSGDPLARAATSADELFPAGSSAPWTRSSVRSRLAGRFESGSARDRTLVDGVEYTARSRPRCRNRKATRKGGKYLFIDRRLDGVSITATARLIEPEIDARRSRSSPSGCLDRDHETGTGDKGASGRGQESSGRVRPEAQGLDCLDGAGSPTARARARGRQARDRREHPHRGPRWGLASSRTKPGGHVTADEDRTPASPPTEHTACRVCGTARGRAGAGTAELAVTGTYRYAGASNHSRTV